MTLQKFDSRLTSLRNFGPKSAKLIESIGIHNPKELAKVGTLETCRRLILAGYSISLNMAYAIEGALMDCDWRKIPIEFRRYLVIEFKKLKTFKTKKNHS